MQKELLSLAETAKTENIDTNGGSMGTLEFLNAILGKLDGGVVSVNWFSNPYPKTKWYGISELPDMVTWSQRIGGKFDTYFSINPRKHPLPGSERGKTEDIYAVCSLCADLDLKGPAHVEDDLPETEEELIAFIKSLPLQPSIIVFSGNGMHLYWLFEEPLVVSESLPYNAIEVVSKGWEKYIKDKAHTEHGWNFDSVSDLPRMLRVPGTINHKNGKEKQCRVIYTSDVTYTPADFTIFTGIDINGKEYTVDRDSSGAADSIEADDDPETRPSIFFTGKSSDILNNCTFLQHCRDDCQNLSEPQWHAAITNLALTFDGAHAIHEISKDYPRYSYAETEQKYKNAAKEDKPVTCDYIHSHFHFKCGKEAECISRGIKCPVGWARNNAADSSPDISGGSSDGSTDNTAKMETKQKPVWQPPIPFHKATDVSFPVDALPEPYASYAKAVAESTQTPVDMASVSILSIMAACMESKFIVQIKPDWKEPMNLYCVVIAPPSERKSAVLRHIVRPLDLYERDYNQEHAAEFEASKAQKRILERRLKFAEENLSKGNDKTTPEELQHIAAEVADFEVANPLHLYVDDITTEKLTSVLAENKGHASLISSEGGIFDTLAGIYTKTVNIDVFLKAYSGDTIRVDRIGRGSEVIMKPALTILLMAQPEVISTVLSNKVFKGRGLTARFLYSAPKSFVGRRNINSTPIDIALEGEYKRAIDDLLRDEYNGSPDVITVSPEAFEIFKSFADEIEKKLKNEYADIAQWAGKLAGNVARIAGLLCRAGAALDPDRNEALFYDGPHLEIDRKTMDNAISIGRYFLAHAASCFDVLPEDGNTKEAEKVLDKIRESRWKTFNRREIMRKCRSFHTVDEIQPVLDFLEDYGYIMRKPEAVMTGRNGRPTLPSYAVNPLWIASSQ